MNASLQQQGIQSLETGLGILEALLSARRPMRLKDIAQACDLSPSKARMYLVSLLRTGYVKQLLDGNLYIPGEKTRSLGLLALSQEYRLASLQTAVGSIANEFDLPVLGERWDGKQLMIIASAESSQANMPLAFRIGGSTPLTTSATGKAFLAFRQPEVRARDILLANEGGASAEYLEASLQNIRKRGWAEVETVHFGSGVALTGMGAVSAPILGLDQEPEFILTIIIPATIAASVKDAVIRRMLSTTKALSLSLPQVPIDS